MISAWGLKRSALLLVVVCMLQPWFLRAQAFAQDIDLTGYQKPDGAISTLYMQDKVDPYFATEALLVADDGGLTIRKPAMFWISWAIKRQQGDGLFERYHRNNEGGWEAYAPSDANDAMQALWLELLYREAATNQMPAIWKNSIKMSEAQLDSIYDPESGIYHIAADLPVGLLMDNVEIYSAFKRIAIEQKRLGMNEESAAYDAKADALGEHILQVFRDPKTGTFAVSTQKSDHKKAFYPDRVVNLFPILHKLVEAHQAQELYSKWMDANGHEWLRQRNDDFPWGLVAITALTMGDNYSASCWQNRAEPMRYSPHWNVLEEVALQDIKYQLKLRHNQGIACVGGDLS